jgi:hypothetical protein
MAVWATWWLQTGGAVRMSPRRASSIRSEEVPTPRPPHRPWSRSGGW